MRLNDDCQANDRCKYQNVSKQKNNGVKNMRVQVMRYTKTANE